MPWRCQVAVDLGTAFFRVATDRFGVVTIPTAAAPRAPLRGGVVDDPQAVAALLRPALAGNRRLGLFGPRVVVGAPTDARSSDRQALATALQAAGAAAIEIVPEPQAAAVGAGLDLSSPYAQMLVDVGEGVTDCAILREGRILATHACRVGCGSLRASVQERFRDCWDLRLSAAEAEQLVATAGVGITAPASSTPIRIGDNVSGRRPVLTVRPTTVQALLEPTVEKILAAATTLLRRVPHALGCEIIESGILLTGGGALLPGLRERLATATSIHVTSPGNPLDTVVIGLQRMTVTSVTAATA
jgi:rod shape-determining protein MreB and related proteins